jgi:hypothetical protein
MRDVDPLDLVEMIREGILVLEPDRPSALQTAPSATCSPSRQKDRHFCPKDHRGL